MVQRLGLEMSFSLILLLLLQIFFVNLIVLGVKGMQHINSYSTVAIGDSNNNGVNSHIVTQPFTLVNFLHLCQIIMLILNQNCMSY